jgi:hypothetical protein
MPPALNWSIVNGRWADLGNKQVAEIVGCTRQSAANYRSKHDLPPSPYRARGTAAPELDRARNGFTVASTLPEKELIDKAAEAAGVSRSAYVLGAALERARAEGVGL